MSDYKKIETIEKLKEICTDAIGEVFIFLNGGFRSSKDVQYYPEIDSWNIYNNIDETDEDYETTEKFREGYPLFFEALKKGALYQY